MIKLTNTVILFLATCALVQCFISLPRKVWIERKLIDFSLKAASNHVIDKSVIHSLPERSISIQTDSDSLLSLELSSAGSDNRGVRAAIKQHTTGKVPRASQPAALVVDAHELATNQDIFPVIEESLRWYLDAGGKIMHLFVFAPDEIRSHLEHMGYERGDHFLTHTSKNSPLQLLNELVAKPKFKVFVPNVQKMLAHVQTRTQLKESLHPSHLCTLYDVLGRLLHDQGQFQQAIEAYTAALQHDNKGSSVWRNLGGAYMAAGNPQMAFASYQQAVTKDADDAIVYLKLAMFYEDFARKDWVDAETLAEKCYRYYLEKVDAEDADVVLRLANLLLREGE
eukprot:gene42856-52366_t